MIRWQVYEDPEYEDYLENDGLAWDEIEIQPVVKIQHSEEEIYSPYLGA